MVKINQATDRLWPILDDSVEDDHLWLAELKAYNPDAAYRVQYALSVANVQWAKAGELLLSVER